MRKSSVVSCNSPTLDKFVIIEIFFTALVLKNIGDQLGLEDSYIPLFRQGIIYYIYTNFFILGMNGGNEICT